MKKLSKLFIGILIPVVFASCTSTNNTGGPVSLDTHMDTVSYVIGLWIGGGPMNVPDKAEFNPQIVAKGITDALSDAEPKFNQMDVQKILQQFSMEQQAKMTAPDVAAGDNNNLEEGQAYLAKNKENPDVKVTPSGLQYRVIKEGTGPKPVATDKVRVHYTGKLLNGEVFDSSHNRGEPTEFMLNQVIPGWTEGLQLMPVGSTYEFVIPSELAYGARGAGQMIQPNATLIFEVELLDIVK